MKKISLLLLAGTTLLLWGCPFESEYTLGDAMLDQYDTRTIGNWENITDSTNQYVRIDPYDPDFPECVLLTITQKRYGEITENDDQEFYKAFFAKVGQVEYLLIEDYDEYFSDGIVFEYYCYKFTDSKNLVISEVNPSFFSETIFSSEEEVLQAFQANQSKPDFLVDAKKYRKY